MRLIDADALNDTVEKSIAKFGEVFSEDLITGLKACVYIAMQQPTIAQPEIIRCRECRYKYGSDCDNFAGVWVKDDDFCSRAERREVDDERPD